MSPAAPRARIALAVLVAGALALLLAEAEVLRVASAALLLAGIGLGVFAIATPAFVEADRLRHDGSRRDRERTNDDGAPGGNP